MANTGIPLIDSLIPTYAYDQVAVFTQEFEQIFKDARAIKAVVKEQSKVMEHPIETGAIISDHRIVLPIEIELNVILNSSSYQDTYKAIRSYYLNGTLLVVQTKTSIYEDMILSGIPHEETPDHYDVISLSLMLRQALFVAPISNIAPKNPTDSPTTDRGQQGISNTNATLIALAVGGFNSFRNLTR